MIRIALLFLELALVLMIGYALWAVVSVAIASIRHAKRRRLAEQEAELRRILNEDLNRHPGLED